MKPGFSQTSVELQYQLAASGWPTDRVVEIARTYEFATELMCMMYRPSGKHFVHHLVGTASILAWCRQRPAVVNAGLLHAIYDFGDFGSTSDRRQFVRDRVGEEIEDIVWRYHSLKWMARTVRELGSGARDVRSIDPELLVMRLANHLEDHLDYGMLYYPGGAAKQGVRPALADHLVRIARSVGADDLANELSTAFDRDEKAVIPEILRSDHRTAWSKSRPDTMLRPSAAVRRAVVGTRHILGRVLRAAGIRSRSTRG